MDSSLPEQTPDVGRGKEDTVTSAVFVNLDLLRDRSIGEDYHLSYKLLADSNTSL
jgi:hypothetical protein